MNIDESEVYLGLARGLESIEREIAAHGSEDDKVCLQYILSGRTGDLERRWANGVMDTGRPIGLALADFAAHANSVVAGLSHAHVAALRLYTSNAFRSINNPLRNRDKAKPYPFPVTLLLITDGIRKLRAVGAAGDEANATISLYRGMRNVDLPADFLQRGGTELAPMSTTSNVSIALRYSASAHGVLFKLQTHSSMERGADLTFLSCFPGEREFLFPPLTYLQPAKPVKKEQVQLAGKAFTVVEVEPKT